MVAQYTSTRKATGIHKYVNVYCSLLLHSPGLLVCCVHIFMIQINCYICIIFLISLIEEFMLMANMAVARKIYECFPEQALLRRHPPPKRESVNRLVCLDTNPDLCTGDFTTCVQYIYDNGI